MSAETSVHHPIRCLVVWLVGLVHLDQGSKSHRTDFFSRFHSEQIKSFRIICKPIRTKPLIGRRDKPVKNRTACEISNPDQDEKLRLFTQNVPTGWLSHRRQRSIFPNDFWLDEFWSKEKTVDWRNLWDVGWLGIIEEERTKARSLGLWLLFHFQRRRCAHLLQPTSLCCNQFHFYTLKKF